RQPTPAPRLVERVVEPTGRPRRLNEREPVVAEAPRRQRLGGVHHGAAVDEGGVGPLARSTERPCRWLPWAQQRLAHKGWRKPLVPVGALLGPAGGEHPACWGSRGSSQGRRKG